MALLTRGIDRCAIARWLGQESVETTQICLHADLRLKEQALARMTPSGLAPGRLRPDDTLLAFLESLRSPRVEPARRQRRRATRAPTRDVPARGAMAQRVRVSVAPSSARTSSPLSTTDRRRPVS
jgi:hypothetical protein